MKNIKQKINKNITLDATKGQASEQIGTPLLVEDSVTVLPETIQPSNDANIGQASGATQEPVPSVENKLVVIDDGAEHEKFELDEFEKLHDDGKLSKLMYDIVCHEFDSNLLFTQGQFFCCRGNHWLPLHELAEVKRAVAKYFDFNIQSEKIKDIVNMFKIFFAKPAFPKPTPNIISVKNGVVHQWTGNLLLPTPRFYLRNQIPINWDPTATCPRWMQFLDDIFRDDVDKVQKIQLVQEWFGYCLTPSTLMQLLLLLIGEGENGKSVFMDVLAALVGEENTSHTMIESLTKQEYLAELDGKLLNISAEVPDSAWKRANVLKAFVTGDRIQARLLYKNPVTITPTAKLMMASNNLPKVYDHTHGFFRKVMILTFNRKFTNGDRNRNIKAEILTELPGILVWAFAGLQRLTANGDFTVPASSEAAKKRYQIDSDDAQMFVEECLEPDPTGAGMRVPEVYWEYCSWAKDSGLVAMNKFAFGKRLARAGVNKRRTNQVDYWLLRRKSAGGDMPVVDQPLPVQPGELEVEVMAA